MSQENMRQFSYNTPSSAPPTIGSFLQSSAWATFQEKAGNKDILISSLGGTVHGFEHVLPFGLSYIYIPHADLSEHVLKEFVEKGKKMGALFLRIEPWKEPLSFHGYSFFRARNRQPQYSLIVPLKKEEEMLRSMHTKTRYNIGLSHRKGVVVRKQKDADIFYRLLEETTKRDGFRAHNKSYYDAMLSLKEVDQYIAYSENEAIASSIIIRQGNTVTYLHGASLHAYRQYMAPYAVQWQAMQDAYKAGALWYDLWGVASPLEPQKEYSETFHTYTWDTRHPFHGITRFKSGFGGVPVRHPEAIELPLRPLWYRLYKMRQQFVRP